VLPTENRAFYEILDSLIDVTRVPADKRTGDEYEAARKEIHDNLATVEDVMAGCHHEAGHLIYANLVGFKYKLNTADFRIVGPQIEYHEATGYDPTPTAIYAPGLHAKIPHTNDGLLDTAKIAVVGGESVRYFSAKKSKPMWKLGNHDDKKRFQRFADGIRNRKGTVIEPYIIHWQDATEEVQKDFASERYVLEIEGAALFAMLKIFPPVFSSI